MVQRYEWVSIVVVILLAFSQWLGIYLGVWTLSSVLSVVPFFIFTAMFGVFLWGIGKRIENALGKTTTTTAPSKFKESELEAVKSSDISPFSRLTIHYSKKTDNPDTLINPNQPIYVTNNEMHTANKTVRAVFLVPDWLKPYIHLHKISSQPHDDEKALRKFISTYLRENMREPVREPLPRELGLKFEGNNIVSLQDELITKLEGHKLEDLRVIFLHRIRARRTLLLKRSTQEAWEAPLNVSKLILSGIIADSENLGMRPWENCSRWSKRQGYTFHPWRYPESELTKGLS
jgi:hypothetical protein